MKHIFNTIILISLISGIYFLTLRGVSGNIETQEIKGNYDQALMPLELSPERGRFILTKSLAEDKSFSLSQDLADAAFPDVGVYQGKYFVYFAPGMSIWALPFYIFGSQYNLAQVFSYLSVTVFALLNVLLIYIIGTQVIKIRASSAMMSSLIFATGSCALSYATTLYQHHATTFFILSGFYAVWKFRQNTNMRFFYAAWTWIIYALSIWIDYPNAILVLPIMVYLFISTFQLKSNTEDKTLTFNIKISAIIASVCFFVLVGAHGYYNYLHFESPTRLSGQLVGYKTLLEDQSTNNDASIASLQAEKQESRFFTEEGLTFGLYTLTLAPDKGLFIFSPIFLISLIGLYIAFKSHSTEWLILGSTVAVHLFLYSSWGDPWGGWAFGPRYLIPSTAILALSIGYLLHTYNKNTIIKIATWALYSVSAGISLLGAFTTNAVPPEIEAKALGTTFGIEYVLTFFNDGKTGSYLVNTYIAQSVNLQEIYLIALAICSLTAFCILLAPGMTFSFIKAKDESNIGSVEPVEQHENNFTFALKKIFRNNERGLYGNNRQ